MNTSACRILIPVITLVVSVYASGDAPAPQLPSGGLPHEVDLVPPSRAHKSSDTKICDAHLFTGIKVMENSTELLQHLKPSDDELLREENKWERSLQMPDGSTRNVIIEYFEKRGSTTYILGKLTNDDLSMLSLVISDGITMGGLTIPKEVSLKITGNSKGVFLKEAVGDIPWTCGSCGPTE